MDYYTAAVIGRIDRRTQRMEKLLAKTRQELDDAIAGLPAKIEAAVDAAVKPIIDAIKAKAPPDLDFTAETDALDAVGATVAGQVATDLTPADTTTGAGTTTPGGGTAPGP